MDRKQQPEMWFVFLLSFSLCTTIETECSIEWVGLKIKIYTKMLEGICDWCCLSLAPGTFSWWPWPAQGQVWMVAKPEHTSDAERISHHVPDAQRVAEEDGEHHTNWLGWGQGAPQGERGGDAGDGWVLVMLGWSTSTFISDVHTHSLCISRTDFKHRNQQIRSPNSDPPVPCFYNIFYYKSKEKSSLDVTSLLKPRRKL